METERRFTKLRLDLIRDKQCFMALGPLMQLGTRELVDGLRSAYTDGVNEKYGVEFLDLLEDAPARFVIVHENYHKMGRHLVLYDKLWKQDARIANMACDYWINGLLDNIAKTNNLIEMPTITQKIWDSFDEKTQAVMKIEGKGVGSHYGLLDHKYDGWSVKQIFDDLMQNQEPEDGEGGEGTEGFDQHDWEKSQELDEKGKEEVRRKVEEAVRAGVDVMKKHGTGSGSANDSLGLNELLKPKVDWRAQLRSFVTATCRKMEQSTWRRPNRRFLHQDIIMPTMQGKSIKSLGVCVDASGSMFGGDPSPFIKVMSEMDGIVKQLQIDKIHLIYWDGDVCQHEVYTPATVGGWRNVTKPRGGGGTDPACVTPWLKKEGIKLDAAVVLTDGMVPGWGQWDVPVLFVVTSKVTANVGKTIHLED